MVTRRVSRSRHQPEVCWLRCYDGPAETLSSAVIDLMRRMRYGKSAPTLSKKLRIHAERRGRRSGGLPPELFRAPSGQRLFYIRTRWLMLSSAHREEARFRRVCDRDHNAMA